MENNEKTIEPVANQDPGDAQTANPTEAAKKLISSLTVAQPSLIPDLVPHRPDWGYRHGKYGICLICERPTRGYLTKDGKVQYPLCPACRDAKERSEGQEQR